MATQQTLCHTLSQTGLRPGFSVELNCSLGVPALFVGELAIGQDNRHGCDVICEGGQTGTVLRAALHDGKVGGSTRSFLVVPSPDCTTHLVYIDLRMPAGWKLRGQKFPAGVHTKSRIIGNKGEHLIVLKKGEEANVHLADGRVVRVKNGKELTATALPLEQTARARIDEAKALIESAAGNFGTREYGVYCLLAIATTAGKASAPIREELRRLVGQLRAKQPFSNRLEARYQTVFGHTPSNHEPRTALGAALAEAMKRRA